ncbi:PREDICTED: centromere protein N-like [Priapulus caudatus]|uniref:Centromere protein N-like n=1 Tax=Priapulus caudatus TaxID=37621 RepID=A0ABM1EQQ1_PRICU|nr:PREDICTED: centromere protein N-like [Priapulus caudatus]
MPRRRSDVADAAMRERCLSVVLGRMTMKALTAGNDEDASSLLSRWSYLRDENESFDPHARSIIYGSTTKRELVSRLVEYCAENATVADVAQLDLLAVRAAGNATWQAYELADEVAIEGALPSDQQLRKRLQRALAPLVEHDVYVETRAGATWMWLWMHGGGGGRVFRASDVVYAACVPHTAHVFTTRTSPMRRRALTHALAVTFGCCEVREMPLRGRCLRSLARLALQRNALPGLSHQLHNELDLPAAPPRGRAKRAAPPRLDGRAVREDEGERAAKRQRVDAAYGTKPQPTLEQVQYRLKTRFRGLQAAEMDSGQLFRCRVTFTGSSVLDGFRNLVSAGMATWPLPPHVSNLHRMARNLIVLEDRRDAHTSG